MHRALFGPALSTVLALLIPLGVPGRAHAQKPACPGPAALTGDMPLPLSAVRYLADDALEGRLAGSAGERCAGDYIAAEFERLGLRPSGEGATYFQSVPLASILNPHAPGGTGRNVMGAIEGADPVRAGEWVVIGAHYDHLGDGGGPNSLAPGTRAIHNGADDNASGVAALLEIARTLAARRDELRGAVVFAAFAGEELGLLGSSRLVKSPPTGLEPARLAAMLNLDMVGRLRDERLTVFGVDTAAEWGELVSSACARARLECKQNGDGYGPSDHTAFYAADVPVLHFFTGVHDQYHRPSDDAPLLNATGGARVAALVADLALQVSHRDERLAVVRAAAPPPSGDVRSFGASLGTIPDYSGPPEGKTGMPLAGVRPDGPAARAGLRRGDLIVGLAGREIRSIEDLMFVLRQSHPGEAAMVVVERDGERLELPIVFGEATRRN
ncbi:MAG TPA: M20/M25/M40 family metallo-hydrolase [Thermoanaerobaculia bacterium]